MTQGTTGEPPRPRVQQQAPGALLFMALAVPALSGVYWLVGSLGSLLAVPPGFASPIFPATGIAVAALLLFGLRLWPGVFIGSFLLQYFTLPYPLADAATAGGSLVAVIIATGATLQAVLGVILANWLVQPDNQLSEEKRLPLFLLLTGPAASVIGVTITCFALAFAGIASADDLPYQWMTRWAGETLGVLLVAPASILIIGGTQQQWIPAQPSIIMALATTAVTVVTIFMLSNYWEYHRIENEFHRHTRTMADTIANRFRNQLQVVASIRQFYQGSEEVTRPEFAVFVQEPLMTFPGIETLAWIPRIPGSRRHAFEKRLRQQGFTGFLITELNDRSERVPALERDSYFPIQFLEPAGSREGPIGLDISTHAVYRNTMEAALSTGTIAVSEPFQVTGDIRNSRRIVALQAIYARNKRLETPAQRRKHLLGFAAGVFVADALLAPVERLLLDNAVSMTLVDQRADPSLQTVAQITVTDEARPLITARHPLDLAGRTYETRFFAGPGYIAANRSWQSWAVLTVGLLFSGLLTIFLLMVSARTASVRRLVETRMAELSATSHSLRQSNDMLHAISEAQERFISAHDRKEIFERLLARLLQLTQSEYGFIGMVKSGADGKPFLRTLAISNIAWNTETRQFYDEHAMTGLEFFNLDSLFGHTLKTGGTVIANEPDKDPRRGGTPPDHPPLTAYCGIPFFFSGRLVGMAGIANRPEGYNQELLDRIRPFIGTCSSLVEAFRVEEIEVLTAQAIKDGETRLRAILDNADEVIVTIDEQGMIETVNPAVERLFGYSPVDLIGKNVSLLMPNSHAARHDQYLQRYLKTGEHSVIGTRRELTGQRKDGTTFPMELSVSEIKLGNRRLFTGFIYDLTERKRVDRLKNEFISTVSHELRTPLTSIRGALSLMESGRLGQLPEPLLNLVQIASRNSDRLVLLINDILDIEKIECGKIELMMKTCNLSELIEQSIAVNDAYAQSFAVTIDFAAEDTKDIFVNTDETRFIQVLTNLLSNAVKFSPKGGRIEIRSAVRETTVEIAVKDYGDGIPEEFRARIFSKFAQADASDTRSRAGTGLGLSIAKSLATLMNGELRFESVVGVGTTFYFSLPLAPQPLQQETPMETSLAE